MKAPRLRLDLASLFVVIILLSSPMASVFSDQTGSWALGLVVPEGSTVGGWRTVTNITADVVLPEANYTDNTILAVVSVMLSDSSVLQISAGLFPDSHSWRGVGWFIRDISMNPQDYVWVLNSTEPQLLPGTELTLSILRSGGTWSYLISGHSGQVFFGGQFDDAAPLSPKSGDQEVFALESYTSTPDVLERLGNLTMVSLQLNGRAVTGGTYYLNDWDPNHRPLFVVGGLPCPSSIVVEDLQNGTFTWGYSVQWKPIDLVPQMTAYTIILVGALAIGSACAFAAVRRTHKSASQGPQRGTSSPALGSKSVHRLTPH